MYLLSKLKFLRMHCAALFSFTIIAGCILFIQPSCCKLRPRQVEGGEWVQKIEDSAFCSIIIPYATELSHTKRLRFEDAKIYYTDKVDSIRIIFSTQNILELCPARELMVDVVEGFLERLNSMPNVEDNFGHYPITADDLELYFSYESYFIEYVDPTYMAWMSLRDGVVRFYDGLLKDFHKDFWNSRVETYEKSYEFVTIQRAAEAEYLKEHPPKNPETFSHLIN